MKFKNKKELIAFICLNIFGSPFIWIIAYAFLNWYGVTGCLIIFLLCYYLWKYFSKNYNAKLLISPKLWFITKK